MKKRAFTLIELLVVIGILALLLSIILPSLLAAKEQARQIYCKNNLRQMVQAAYVYTTNHDGYYPIAYYTKTGFALVPKESTVCVVEPPDGSATEIVTCTYCWDFTTITSDDTKKIAPGILWEGDTTRQINQCPSYKGQDNWSGVAYSGYNYNTSYIGHGEGETVSGSYPGEVIAYGTSTVVMPAKSHQVRSTARCILFGDGYYSGGANKLMRSPIIWDGDTDWTLRTGGTQGFRHRGQTDIAWADGHVTAQAEYYTETHSKYKVQLDAYNEVNKIKIGFISPNNSLYDLK